MNAEVETKPIILQAFLQHIGVASTGGHAKLLIQDGEVCVNGEIETRRKKKLVPGDKVSLADQEFIVGV